MFIKIHHEFSKCLKHLPQECFLSQYHAFGPVSSQKEPSNIEGSFYIGV